MLTPSPQTAGFMRDSPPTKPPLPRPNTKKQGLRLNPHRFHPTPPTTSTNTTNCRILTPMVGLIIKANASTTQKQTDVRKGKTMLLAPQHEDELRHLAHTLGIELEPRAAMRPHKAFTAHTPQHEDLHIDFNFHKRIITLTIGAPSADEDMEDNAYPLDEMNSIKNALVEWKATGKITANPGWAYAHADITHLHRIGQSLVAEGILHNHTGSGKNYIYEHRNRSSLRLINEKYLGEFSIFVIDEYGNVIDEKLIDNHYCRVNKAVRQWAEDYSVFERGTESYICQEIDFLHIGRIHTREEIHIATDLDTGELVASCGDSELRINRYSSPKMGSVYGFRETGKTERLIPSNEVEEIHNLMWEFMENTKGKHSRNA